METIMYVLCKGGIMIIMQRRTINRYLKLAYDMVVYCHLRFSIDDNLV